MRPFKVTPLITEVLMTTVENTVVVDSSADFSISFVGNLEDGFGKSELLTGDNISILSIGIVAPGLTLINGGCIISLDDGGIIPQIIYDTPIPFCNYEMALGSFVNPIGVVGTSVDIQASLAATFSHIGINPSLHGVEIPVRVFIKCQHNARLGE